MVTQVVCVNSIGAIQCHIRFLISLALQYVSILHRFRDYQLFPEM